MKQTIVVIVGPTAVGKTKLSIQVANRYNGEIISGDSMQIYKKMDIGTAKITKEEQQGVPHYMIDIKDPDETFSVADFKQHVHYYIDEIGQRGKLPIVVGGSGLYVQAIIYDYHFSNIKRDIEFTKKLEQEVEKQGIIPLYERLKRIDPEQAEKIHPNNHRRVIRALEIYKQTGLTMTEYQKKQRVDSPYRPIIIGLEMDRKYLYERINKRVDQMIHNGLVEEVQFLYERGFENVQAMQAIGYKEFIPYFKGEYPLERAIELLKRNSRRYAKRQYTWFRNKLDVKWYTIHPNEVDKKFNIILENLAGLLKES